MYTIFTQPFLLTHPSYLPAGRQGGLQGDWYTGIPGD